jgi:hypothetical protein
MGRPALVFLLLGFTSSASVYAQSAGGNSGSVRGTVLDPSGAAIAGATVEIQNPVSHFTETATSDNQGNFQLLNVQYNNYHLTAKAPGFESGAADIDVRSPVPVVANLTLKIGASTESVQVTAEAGDLVETTPVTHTDIDRELLD